ncbi:MAG: hypothetical protein ACK58L_02155 [Planctomycetota bacterium]
MSTKSTTDSSLSFASSMAILWTRLALSFWVGGAILFVITSVAEQINPAFDSPIRDQLATIRFPHYYRFGGICLGVALAGSLFAVLRISTTLRRRMVLVFLLTLVSTGIMVFDYWNVYVPLQQLITPPGKERTQEFLALHHQSRIVNQIHLGVALVAGLIASWPISVRRDG